MFISIDLATLRLCSVLACVTFAIIFVALWRGRSDQLHHAHWAASLLLYCVALAGLEWIYLPEDVMIRALLVTALTASNILVVTGVRLFAKRPLWRWWMGIPPAATLIGFLLPHLVRLMGGSLPSESEQVLGAMGLALGMGVFGLDIMRQSRRAVPHGYGGRIAGLTMMAYIPCYLYAIVGEVLHLATPGTLATAALLSDQLLLMLLNLGLIAMPAESALAALRESTWRDGLTRVYNRAWLATNEHTLLRAGTWLAHIDVDHFKSINDRYGHAAGDAALVGLARALTMATEECETRRAGHAVRMGGDEFLVIMPEASLPAAQRLAHDVRAAISRLGPFEWTVSTGLAGVEPEDRSFSDVIERADRQLYAAKLAGRNRVAA
ncbi:diguanylate cyclase [Pseudomonas sp.]|uniref:GGDEF domain-containing protein n=1 Tax=Pseudomonas sp. TaxID=306 RepID=UPI0025FD41A5|nr:GGDEF domain-containing protein [Pseudomonas sp.]